MIPVLARSYILLTTVVISTLPMASKWECLFLHLRDMFLQAPVAHPCNLSYSGSRDQEDHSSKPAWGNSSWDPILKNPSQKYGWWSESRWRPWVQAPIPSLPPNPPTQRHVPLFLNWEAQKLPSGDDFLLFSWPRFSKVKQCFLYQG
jgi:hypothetical protein